MLCVFSFFFASFFWDGVIEGGFMCVRACVWMYECCVCVCMSVYEGVGWGEVCVGGV